MKRTGLTVPGAEVLALRLAHGYTRREFARMAGVSSRTVEGWDRRETPICAMKVLKISIILDEFMSQSGGNAYAKLIQDIRAVLEG